jgi:hypothetical protein
MVEQSEPGSPAHRLGLSLRRRDVVGLLVGLVALGEIVHDVRVLADA